MKYYLPILLFSFLGLVSCRNDTHTLNIIQVSGLLYEKTAQQDVMLTITETNITKIAPSFLSYLSCVLPNTKHNMVTNNMNRTSMSILESRGIALIALLAPSTNKILKMFEPITFPIINWFSPFFKAVSEVTNSGKEVPIATIVKPTNVSLIPKAIAIDEALSTTKSPPITIPASPIKMKIMQTWKCRFFFTYFKFT